jgi:hypothetical protein
MCVGPPACLECGDADAHLCRGQLDGEVLQVREQVRALSAAGQRTRASHVANVGSSAGAQTHLQRQNLGESDSASQPA